MAKVVVCVYLITNGPFVAENVNVCKQTGDIRSLQTFLLIVFAYRSKLSSFFYVSVTAYWIFS